MDPSGYIKITGRIKDLIIRGGENIHPLEIENCLLAHPGVSDVSVVGLKDERYGEVVAAFVIRATGRELASQEGPSREGMGELTEEDVRKWVKERLSHHLVPKYVFWTEGFPKTASGKVQKFLLREEGERSMKKEKIA